MYLVINEGNGIFAFYDVNEAFLSAMFFKMISGNESAGYALADGTSVLFMMVNSIGIVISLFILLVSIYLKLKEIESVNLSYWKVRFYSKRLSRKIILANSLNTIGIISFVLTLKLSLLNSFVIAIIVNEIYCLALYILYLLNIKKNKKNNQS